MYFSAAAFVFGLVALSTATPTPRHFGTKFQAKRALTSQAYADFQVSDGVAGNALAEAQAKFPLDTSNLAGVSASDLAILQSSRLTAEAAETSTGGFNDGISSASGATAAALQNGKIKNKVLKLFLEVTALQVQQAQGRDASSQIIAEQTKLNNNIALDKKAAGQASQGVEDTFSG